LYSAERVVGNGSFGVVYQVGCCLDTNHHHSRDVASE
jgi:hypothetical protein